MHPLRSRLLFASFAVLSAGCAYARSVAIGSPVPARPPSCALEYARIAPGDAQPSWRQVGAVCVSRGSGFSQQHVYEVYEPGDQRDLLTARACALGGEMVTPVGLCTNGKSNAIEFGVYVPRERTAPMQPDPADDGRVPL
ncbi:MAG: hypothetical protein ABSE49_01555 [Polyangiaceae bacterium]|jgi:hypothetical protein